MKFKKSTLTGLSLLVFAALILSLAACYGTSAMGHQDKKPEPEQSDSKKEPVKTETPDPKVPEPVAPTLTDFLKTSIIPKDQVLYVWGGGWNEEDTGGNEEANSEGLADSWLDFFNENANGYDADLHTYEIHSGLDCSGYLGWVLHNTFLDKQDYVHLSESTGPFLESLGYGTSKPADEITELLPGDIMYTKDGHVYIVLGQYDDGSILLIHSSPPGVRVSGTYGKAYQAALQVQTNEWDPLADDTYYTYDQFRFNETVLPDPDHIRSKTPDEILSLLFEQPENDLETDGTGS